MPEFVESAVREGIAAVGALTLTPWETGYCESFNGKLQDELLIDEILYALKEAQIVIETGGTTTTQRVYIYRWNIDHRHARRLSGQPQNRWRKREL